MTSLQISPSLSVAKDLLGGNPDGLKELVRAVLQEVLEVLEAEMAETIGAAKGERNAERSGYRAGSYPRTIVTRVGKIELRAPQDRDGRFSTELFQRYQRSEQALVASAICRVHATSSKRFQSATISSSPSTRSRVVCLGSLTITYREVGTRKRTLLANRSPENGAEGSNGKTIATVSVT